MPWFGVIWIKVCGTWLGYPSKRRRNLSWSWNRDRLIWTGPAEQKDVQADFDRLFPGIGKTLGASIVVEKVTVGGPGRFGNPSFCY